MSEKLFEITTDNLETGLRGYPIGYCTTSTVDPTKGLFYADKKAEEMAFREPEEVVFLLYNGREGTPEELKKFKEDLKKRAPLKKETIEAIEKLPRHGRPMALFAAALLILGMEEGKEDYKEDCLNLIAKLPEVVAVVINHRAGWGKTKPSNPSLGMIENFTQMLNVPNKNEKLLTEVFKLFQNLHLDHGGGNLSTFVGKAIASGLEDMYGSIAGSMNALAGPRHGRANQDCLEFNEAMLKALGDKATAADVEKYMRNILANNGLIFGFGHAVLRVEDPRAQLLYDFAKERFPENPLVKIALLIRSEGPKVLKENPKISDPYPNVDAISGTVLAAAGFNYPDYFTVLFGLSRAIGIAIQIVYERVYARDGKGTPIVRPKYIYKPRVSK